MGHHHKTKHRPAAAPESKPRYDVGMVRAVYEAIAHPCDREQPSPANGGNEKSVLPAYPRLLSVAEARNLHENDLTVGGLLTGFSTHVVGEVGGKIVYNTQSEEWNKKASKLTKAWQADCDYRIPDWHFNDWLQVALPTFMRDGDFLLVFDKDVTEHKLLTFEADQIASVGETDWPAMAKERGYVDTKGTPWPQFSGVVTNPRGQVVAHVASVERGRISHPAKECSLYPAKISRMIFRAMRLQQYRGNSVLLAMLDIISDFRELIKSEIKSAKRTAREAIIVQQENPTQAILDATQITLDQLTEGTGETLPQAQAKRYEVLDKNYGGETVYAGLNDKITHVKNDRPAPQIAEFQKHTTQSCGHSLGMYKMFSTGEVTTSYSAARAELLLTHAMFRCLQKFLERRVIDWIMRTLITDWIAAGELDELPDDMDVPSETYTVVWPELPILDPVAEVDAALKRLKGGLSNWDIELGGDAKKILLRLSENIKFLRDNDLDILSIFESVAGAKSGTDTKTQQQKENKGTQQ